MIETEHKFRPIGNFLPMDAQGRLQNPCAEEKIAPRWRPAVEALKAVYISHLGSHLHSLYLRGSVPQGLALEGIADLDSFAVLNIDPREFSLAWAAEEQKKLKRRFPFVKDFEFNFYFLRDVLLEPGFLSIRFTIKYLSLCIGGGDLSKRLDPIPLNLSLARAFHGDIGPVFVHVLRRMKTLEDPGEIQRGCAFIQKRLLRTGFGLVMEQEGKFTRDLFRCHQIFKKYYPEKEREIFQALQWAVEPTPDKGKLLPFLEGFGSWVVGEAEKKFSRL